MSRQEIPRLRRVVFAALLLGLGVSDVVFGGRGSWTSGGPEGGSVAAIVVAPSSPNVVYATMNDGLIFRSIDSGTNWRIASVGLPVGPILFQGIELLAVDAGSALTVYACPGDRLFKSTDGGGDWAPLAIPPVPAIYGVAADPKTPGTIYIATALGGLYKSIDGGVSWAAKNSGLTASVVETIAISPSDPSKIYASANTGIFLSRDAGEHWVAGSFVFSAAVITVKPTDPATAIATGPAFTDAYLTRDFGASWAPLVIPAGWYVTSVLFDPDDPSAIFAAGYTPNEAPVLVRSPDLGSTWATVAAGPPGEIIDCLAIPSLSTLLAGFLKSGVFRSGDLGRTWTPSNNGLVAVFMNSLAVSPSDPNRLYSGTWDGHLYRSDDGGSRWILTALESLGVNSVSVDPQDSRTAYVSVRVFRNFETLEGGAILRSNDGGASWVEILEGIEPFDVVVVDPVVPSTIYAGANSFHNHGLLKSADGGVSWSAVNPGIGTATLVIDPALHSRLYAGGSDGIFRSDDAGVSWQPLGSPRSIPLHLFVGNEMNPTVFVSASDGTSASLFRSVDLGEHWLPTNGLPPALDILVTADPRVSTTFYAGIPDGELFVSRDDGVTWRSMVEGGLPNVGIAALATIPGRGLVAATGGGVYEIDFVSISPVAASSAAPVKGRIRP